MKTLSTILLFLPLFALSNEPTYHELKGSMLIWGDNLPNGKDKDLEGLSIFIRGDAAERLYKKIKSKAIYNECFSNGTITKSQGMFECHLSKSGEYSCDFGISTKQGKMYASESC